MPKEQHVYNRINAYRFLKKLNALQTPQEKFYFLRGLDAFVFEEMILTSLKRQGYIIVRNDGYTGDGGVDGRAYLNDQHYLIQAKRYSGHIKAKDIEDFAKICNRRKGIGLFIHTGKTGDTAKEAAQKLNVKIISGVKLLELLDFTDEEKTLTRSVINLTLESKKHF